MLPHVRNAAAAATTAPLCVDLDRALLLNDFLFESLCRLARAHPWQLLLTPFWLLRGRADLQNRIDALAPLDPACLPYDRELLDRLGRERAAGRPIHLISNSNPAMADAVARHLGIFDSVVSGNAPRTELRRPAPSLVTIARALRIRQWPKNLLIFVPLITSHEFTQLPLVLVSAAAFLAFSLAASAMYLVNDLLDLDADRRHPRKASRPLASGKLSIPAALLLAALLIAASTALAFNIRPLVGVYVIGYAAASLAYSLVLKKALLADAFMLGLLYTARLVVGGAATQIMLSPWLLSFSMFCFLSLALAKRASDLRLVEAAGQNQTPGRAYLTSDQLVVTAVGCASAVVAGLIIVLYLQSPLVLQLYRTPGRLWIASPALTYWLCRIWVLTLRGVVEGDPLDFALRDRVSYLLVAILIAAFLSAL